MSLNSIDLLMAIVITAVIFIGRKEGLIAGLFKLFGIICVIFITLHYYAQFADILRDQIFGKKMATEFFAFCLLAIPTSFLFIFICHGWVLIIRFKIFAAIDHWSGLILAMIRSYFICGLLFIALLLVGHSYATPRARSSVSNLFLGHAAVGLYKLAYTDVIQKYFPVEEINEHVFMLVGYKHDKKNKP